MNTHVELTLPRTVANKADSYVATLPQNLVFSLLEYSMTDAEGTPSSRHLPDIDAAVSYLSTDFLPAYKKAAGDVPKKLEQASKALTDALQAIRGEIGALSDPGDKTAINSAARTIEDLTVPTIKTFQDSLFEAVLAYEAEHSGFDVDNSALANIAMIAKKINFIAVNASVEAARVGDVGRGFAVIATEIRELSLQAAGAVAKLKEQLS